MIGIRMFLVERPLRHFQFLLATNTILKRKKKLAQVISLGLWLGLRNGVNDFFYV